MPKKKQNIDLLRLATAFHKEGNQFCRQENYGKDSELENAYIQQHTLAIQSFNGRSSMFFALKVQNSTGWCIKTSSMV